MLNTKMINPNKIRCLLYGILSFFVFYVILLNAGKHPKSKFEYDEQSGKGFFDLVLSVNWNPAPDQRDSIESAFKNFC